MALPKSFLEIKEVVHNLLNMVLFDRNHHHKGISCHTRSVSRAHHRFSPINIVNFERLLINLTPIDVLYNATASPDEVNVLADAEVCLHNLIWIESVHLGEFFLNDSQYFLRQQSKNLVSLQIFFKRAAFPGWIVQFKRKFFLID